MKKDIRESELIPSWCIARVPIKGWQNKSILPLRVCLEFTLISLPFYAVTYLVFWERNLSFGPETNSNYSFAWNDLSKVIKWAGPHHLISFHSLAIFLSRVSWCRWGRKMRESSLMTDYDEVCVMTFAKAITVDCNLRTVLLETMKCCCCSEWIQRKSWEDAWQNTCKNQIFKSREMHDNTFFSSSSTLYSTKDLFMLLWWWLRQTIETDYSIKDSSSVIEDGSQKDEQDSISWKSTPHPTTRQECITLTFKMMSGLSQMQHKLRTCNFFFSQSSRYESYQHQMLRTFSQREDTTLGLWIFSCRFCLCLVVEYFESTVKMEKVNSEAKGSKDDWLENY